jgi:hypothetical protein
MGNGPGSPLVGVPNPTMGGGGLRSEVHQSQIQEDDEDASWLFSCEGHENNIKGVITLPSMGLLETNAVRKQNDPAISIDPAGLATVHFLW